MHMYGVRLCDIESVAMKESVPAIVHATMAIEAEVDAELPASELYSISAKFDIVKKELVTHLKTVYPEKFWSIFLVDNGIRAKAKVEAEAPVNACALLIVSPYVIEFLTRCLPNIPLLQRHKLKEIITAMTDVQDMAKDMVRVTLQEPDFQYMEKWVATIR